MSREQARQERREDPSCVLPSSQSGCSTTANSRRIYDLCGDIVIPNPCDIDVSKFFGPQTVAASDLVTPTLPSVTISNSATSRNCSQLPGAGGTVLGDAVTVSAGAITLSVYLAGLDNVTLLQRQHLDALPQDVLNTWPGFTAAQVAESGQLTLTQATALLAAFSAAQSQVNASAASLALASLVCRYENTTQTATCPSGVDVGEGTPVVTVAAGEIASQISQDDANAQALALAAASLVCVWTNDAAYTSCLAAGFPTIPNDDNNDPVAYVVGNAEPTGEQVNTVTVPAGYVKSTASKLDANTQAAALAASFLNCFYLNEEKIGTCDPSADLSSEISTVEARAVISRVSRDDANTQAQTLADSQTICRFKNTEQTFNCNDPENPSRDLGRDSGLDPETNYHAASETASLVFRAKVLAGEITSDISVADANEQAKTLALAQLNCAWCNDAVGAVCAPTSIPSVTGSIDETDPVDAGDFCASSYLLAQDIAINAAAVTKQAKRTGTDTCTFENEAVRATCAPPAVANPDYVEVNKGTDNLISAASAAQFIIVAKGAITSTVSAADATTTASSIALAQLDCFWESEEETFDCDPDVNGVPVSANANTGFTVPAGMFVSYTSLSLANTDRNTYASTLLDCFWESEEETFDCAPDVNGVSVSANSKTGFTVPAGQFVSYVSRAAANIDRNTYGATLLDCFWESRSKTFDCGPDANGVLVSNNSNTGFVVPAGQFVSYVSRAAAEIDRNTYGATLLDCFWDSAEINLKCTPEANINVAFAPQKNYRPDSAQTIVIGDGKFDGVAQVAAKSSGSTTREIIVKPRTLRSEASQEEANTLALTLARSQLNCFYYNNEIKTGTCDPSTIPIQDSVVAVGSVRSEESQSDANTQAQTLANALTICADPDDIGGGGDAGPAGPAGTCTNPCGAYYA